MNIFIIGILVIIILFALYYASLYYNLDYIIKKGTPLKQDTQLSFASTEIDAPASIRYFYEAWIYIDSNMPVDKFHILFNRSTDFVVSLKGSSLYMHSIGGKIDAGEYVPDASSVSFEITKQFPFQKWCHLVLNVDGPRIDAYIDGKLFRSKDMGVALPVSSTAAITVGNKRTEGKITRFRRTGGNISPEGVYTSYMVGSGESMSASDYGVSVGFMKNDTVRREIKLF